jgi:hypothetical protein
MRLAQEPWLWRKAVLATDLTAARKVAAFALLEFVNRKSGYTFASQETIAETCGLTERGFRAAVVALKKAGFLRVVRRGKEESNLMYLELPVTGTAVPVNDTVTGTDVQSDRHGGDKVTGTTMPPNLRLEPLKEPLKDITISHPSEGEPIMTMLMIFDVGEPQSRSPNSFDQWWKIYPRKIAPARAEKAYHRVLKNKKATAAELLSSAQRYAAERKGQDPKFTKHPTTWLNGGCWADEPTTAIATTTARSSQPNSATFSGMARWLSNRENQQ